MTNEKYDKLMLEALRLYKEQQLKSIPLEDEIDYEFSESFQKKIEKLIRKQKKAFWRFFQSAGRKAAAIILALIIGLSATLSIDAIREPIFEFFYRVFLTHTDIEYSQNSNKTITEYYTLSKVPDDYIRTADTFFNELSTYISWANNTGKQIKLRQSSKNTSTNFDSEDGRVRETSINGINTLYCNNGSLIICTWTEYGYCFTLIYPSELEENFMYEVIGKLVVAEDLNQSALNQQGE